MFYLINKLYYYYLHFAPLFLYIIFILSLCGFNYFLFCLKLNNKYKIHHFDLNSLFIFCYILYYVIILFILRSLTINKSLNLLDLYIYVQNTLSKNIFNSIFLILIAITLFLSLKKINSFLKKELRKRFIFSYHHKTYQNFIKQKKDCEEKNISFTKFDDSFFTKLVDNFAQNYSHKTFVKKVLYDLSCILSLFQYKMNPYIIHNKKVMFFVKIIPYVLFIVFFFYFCYYNNFIITKIFYYMPILYIYNLWYNISYFVLDINKMLLKIIYERYYEEDFVLYINTDDNEDNVFNNYLARHLINPTKDYYYDNPNKYIEVTEEIINWCLTFQNNRRFHKSEQLSSDEKYVYINEHTGNSVIFTKKEIMTIKNSKDD